MVTEGGLGEDVRTALEGGVDWVWALDADVAPEPAALERLLGVLGDLGPLPAPMLLAGRVLTPDGALDPGSLPFAEVRDPELVVAAFERRVLCIRAAPRGSLLVHRRAVERWGLPRSPALRTGEDLEWTARILRREYGFAVPSSVAVRHRQGQLSRRAATTALLRLICSDALAPRERAQFGLDLIGSGARPRPSRRPRATASKLEGRGRRRK